jgi:hypothetical protein
MNHVAVAFRPTRALLLVISLLFGYAGLIFLTTPTDPDEGISRVELLE